MAEVLLVGKPVAPPWNDSSKNLARDVALGLQRHRARVLSRPGVSLGLDRGGRPVLGEPLHAAEGRATFGSNVGDQARVLRRLLLGPRADLWHFFFAPNPRSSTVGRFASRLRRMRTVHTVASAPRTLEGVRSLLFADVTVVLSKKTERELLTAGVPAANLRRIAPGIEPLMPPDAAERARAKERLGLPTGVPLLVYPGDLEFGRGAFLAVDALRALGHGEAHLILACRAKTPRALQVRREVEQLVTSRKLTSQVTFLGETPAIHDLLGCADLVLMVTDTLYAKMDYPLVVLEAMSLARPVLVGEGTAVAELEEEGVLAIPPTAEAIAAHVAKLLADETARASLGRRACDAVRSRFDRTTMAAAYEDLYDALLSR